MCNTEIKWAAGRRIENVKTYPGLSVWDLGCFCFGCKTEKDGGRERKKKKRSLTKSVVAENTK